MTTERAEIDNGLEIVGLPFTAQIKKVGTEYRKVEGEGGPMRWVQVKLTDIVLDSEGLDEDIALELATVMLTGATVRVTLQTRQFKMQMEGKP